LTVELPFEFDAMAFSKNFLGALTLAAVLLLRIGGAMLVKHGWQPRT